MEGYDNFPWIYSNSYSSNMAAKVSKEIHKCKKEGINKFFFFYCFIRFIIALLCYSHDLQKNIKKSFQ